MCLSLYLLQYIPPARATQARGASFEEDQLSWQVWGEESGEKEGKEGEQDPACPAGPDHSRRGPSEEDGPQGSQCSKKEASRQAHDSLLGIHRHHLYLAWGWSHCSLGNVQVGVLHSPPINQSYFVSSFLTCS